MSRPLSNRIKKLTDEIQPLLEKIKKLLLSQTGNEYFRGLCKPLHLLHTCRLVGGAPVPQKGTIP